MESRPFHFQSTRITRWTINLIDNSRARIEIEIDESCPGKGVIRTKSILGSSLEHEEGIIKYLEIRSLHLLNMESFSVQVPFSFIQSFLALVQSKMARTKGSSMSSFSDYLMFRCWILHYASSNKFHGRQHMLESNRSNISIESTKRFISILQSFLACFLWNHAYNHLELWLELSYQRQLKR